MNADTELVMLVPSRGRPQNVVDLLGACMGVTTTDTQLAILVDDDDPLLPDYQELLRGEQFAELVVVGKSALPPPGRLCQILNSYAPAYARRHPLVGFMGDDHRPRTKGWDDALIQALDRPGVAYGNDLLQQENLPTACVISSELISALGYMCPPPCEHLFLDDFWKLLGQSAGNLAYLKDVIVEHCHAVAGKAPWDAGYSFSMHPDTMNRDRERYGQFLNGQWQADKLKIEALRG